MTNHRLKLPVFINKVLLAHRHASHLHIIWPVSVKSTASQPPPAIYTLSVAAFGHSSKAEQL